VGRGVSCEVRTSSIFKTNKAILYHAVEARTCVSCEVGTSSTYEIVKPPSLQMAEAHRRVVYI
jgi:hypothetical protein